ncbi:50S ribosomal protein L23 [Candidatus Curtissbacteria bacterium]|nr:50S ribosomal protein L23 [Candidatus Curtissbacteria bacterium]
MKPTDLIKTSILSEKAYKQMENGIYTFLVDKRSTKNQIVKAVENQFAVNVIRVNVSKKSFKMKRIGRTRKQAKVGGGKKAIVYLKAGQNIAILSPSKKETKSIKKEK